MKRSSVIRNAAKRLRAHIDQYKYTHRAEYARKLLKEIDEAVATLLSSDLRRAYDV